MQQLFNKFENKEKKQTPKFLLVSPNLTKYSAKLIEKPL